MYHNTLYIKGLRLKAYQSFASKQDSKVLEFMAYNRNFSFTAEQIKDMVLQNAPLTSARRALSNLYHKDRVIKVDQVDGQYGRPIFTWQYKPMEVEL